MGLYIYIKERARAQSAADAAAAAQADDHNKAFAVRLRGAPNTDLQAGQQGSATMRSTLEEEAAQARSEGMTVWIASHGGVGSNSFASHVESMGARATTKAWRDSLSLANRPVPLLGLRAALYLYGDPLSAICSMKRRGIAELNLKKLLRLQAAKWIVNYDDGRLIEAMYTQFKAWTTANVGSVFLGYSIFHVRYEDTNSASCIRKIGAALGLQHTHIRTTPYQRRYNSPCMAELKRVLSSEQLRMAKEIDDYGGDCGPSLVGGKLHGGQHAGPTG